MLTARANAVLRSISHGLAAAWSSTAILYSVDIIALPSAATALTVSSTIGLAAGLLLADPVPRPVAQTDPPQDFSRLV